MATHSNDHGTDKGAAFTGLVIGIVFLLIVALTTISLTNRHFANRPGHAPAAAGAAQH